MTTINICDICETRDNVSRVRLVYDRTMDGSGSSSDDCEIFDLCEHCELKIYKTTIKDKFTIGQNYDFNKGAIKNIKENYKGRRK